MSDHLSDPILNCLLEVCCEPAAAERQLAETLLVEDVCDDKVHAAKCAAWLYRHFDLAPRGTLSAFKARIATVARARR